MMEGKTGDQVAELVHFAFPGAYSKCVAVFGPTQIANFLWVPLHHRLLVHQTVGLGECRVCCFAVAVPRAAVRELVAPRIVPSATGMTRLFVSGEGGVTREGRDLSVARCEEEGGSWDAGCERVDRGNVARVCVPITRPKLLTVIPSLAAILRPSATPLGPSLGPSLGRDQGGKWVASPCVPSSSHPLSSPPRRRPRRPSTSFPHGSPPPSDPPQPCAPWRTPIDPSIHPYRRRRVPDPFTPFPSPTAAVSPPSPPSRPPRTFRPPSHSSPSFRRRSAGLCFSAATPVACAAGGRRVTLHRLALRLPVPLFRTSTCPPLLCRALPASLPTRAR
jgi:hypothetical protein